MHLTRMLSRLACASLLCALLGTPAGAALAAEPAGPPVEVTAIVEAADGRLSFVTQRAASRRSGTDLARRLDARPDVVAASLEQPVYAVGSPDPLRSQQWGLTRLAAEQVWAGGTATGQVVAVLDTGVDAAHPDLAGIVAPGLDVVTATGTATIDPHGHGTHVAGVVAAIGENGFGGAGLGQGVRVLPVRVLDQSGAGTDGDVARGMVWAVDNGATVLNLSLGGPNPSSLLTSAVEYALARDVVVIAAAGNAGANGDPVLYPAATRGVIAVGAVRSDDTRPTWSSTGSHLSLAAPGVGIMSTVPGGGHASWSGTSMAAPFVAAAAALVRAGEPSLAPAQLRSRLMATARDLGAPGLDSQYGAGLVDVLAARAAGLPAGAPSDDTSDQPVAEPVSEPVAPAPAPVAPAPAPVAPAPAPVAPAPVPVAPAPVPVAPAPVPVAPAPVPVAPAPVPVAPAPAPAPVAPAPAPVTPAPAAVTIRTSRSAAVVLPRRPVVLASRVLVDARVAGGTPVALERRVGTGPWTTIRTGTTRPDGLVAWTLLPDLSGEHRFRTGSTVSGTVRVDVRQVVTAAARRSGNQVLVDATVAPGGRSTVALQVPRGNGWATIATTVTDAAGRARFVRPLPRGTRLRVYAPTRPALLLALSRELRP